MEESRGVLFFTDPTAAPARRHTDFTHMTLIFHENERHLTQAQEALWQARKRMDWVCVAAEGWAAGAALALAAQLPVDRVALWESRLFSGGAKLREIARLNRFARRNLALVTAEILLIKPDEREISGFLRAVNRRQLCLMEPQDGSEKPWAGCNHLLCAPWARVNENNLLIPWKCV